MFLVTKFQRIVRKQFGGFRNFIIWLVSVSLAIYVIDSFILTSRHSRVFFSKKSPSLNLDPSGINAFLVAPDDGPAPDDQQPEKLAEEKLEKEIPDENRVEDSKNQPQADREVAETADCGVEGGCPYGEYSFSMQSGYGRNYTASICFNGDYLVSSEQGNTHRGMNIVVINEKSMNVDDLQMFDVYFTDIALLEYLKDNMHEDQIMFIASQDEASYSLKGEARAMLSKLGSAVIKKIGFRDNYLIIGKKGLPVGSAIEMMKTRVSGKDFADAIQMSGCLPVPLKANSAASLRKSYRKELTEEDLLHRESALRKKNSPLADASRNKAAGGGDKQNKYGRELPNCGVSETCGPDTFPVQLYTGLKNKDFPKICVDGKYVMASDLNGAARGLNFVVVNPETKEVVRVANFDTFGTDNIALEMFLELLNDGDIVMAVAFDEASEKLEKAARLAIEALGSSFVRMLSFRDVWAFIGQKGIVGFTPLEEFSPSNATKASLAWPNPIDFKTCVPTHLTPLKKKKFIHRNFKRKVFCKSHDGYGDFCAAKSVDDPLNAAELTEEELASHAIFKVPIIVVAGLNHNALRMQLEGLFSNPGINPEYITVFYDDKFKESKALADVFDVESVPLPSSTKYADLLKKAIVKAWDRSREMKYLIVLEEEVVPTSDFLNFFRQCFADYEADRTLHGISSWNPYGFKDTSSLEDVAYRAEIFPGLGFLFSRSFYDTQMKDKMDICCSARSWEGWLTRANMIIPEVSRVSRGRYEGRTTEDVRELFNRPRQTVRSGQYEVTNANSLTLHAYEAYIKTLVKSSAPLTSADLMKCVTNKNSIFNISANRPPDAEVIAVYYETSRNNSALHQLCRCFGLGPRAAFTLHTNMLRFSQAGKTVLLIGSSSPYYHLKPAKVKPVAAGG